MVGTPIVFFGKILLGGGINENWNPQAYSGDIVGIVNTPSGALGHGWGTISYPTSNSCRNIVVFDLNDANGVHKTFTVPVFSLISNWLDIGYQVQINPAITKTSSNKMTYTFELSWGRYTP